MTRQLMELQRENAQLEAQVAKFEAVDILQQKAREMGFVPAEPEQIEYLPVDNYPPVPGEGIPKHTALDPSAISTGSTWWQRLTRGFTGWVRSEAKVGGGGLGVDY
jgi:hypothetical protein